MTGWNGLAPELIDQLITPLIFFVFALGFAIIWSNYRQFKSAGYFSLSYFAGTVAFVLEALVTETDGFSMAAYIGDICYVATAALFSLAVYHRYSQKPPYAYVAALTAVLIVLLTWYRFLNHDVEMRTQIVSYGCGLLLLTGLGGIKGTELKAIDRIFFWLLAFFGAQFFVTTYLILNLGNEELTVANFTGSMFLAVINFIVSALSLSMAVTLFVKYGMDIINVFQIRSNTDDLTHLLNRRGFEDKADMFICEAKTTGSDLSMAVCDIDHFKGINDRFGHDIGDATLVAFAKFVTENIRQSDMIGRIGGEEFCIMFPKTDLDQARKIGEKLRRKIQDVALCDKRPDMKITVSCGVAQWQAEEAYNTLFKRADEALYSAKQNGRNRVE